MLLFFIFSAAARLAITLPITTTPITIGVWILLFATISATIVAILSTSWFGLILFIIYVGGLLVMFSYFSAVSPNQQIKISSAILVAALALITILLVSFKTLSSLSHSAITHFLAQPNLTLLFSGLNLPILLFLALLLLLAMIVVVKLAQRSEGPLRPFK